MIVQEKKPQELLEDRIFTISNLLSVSRVFLYLFSSLSQKLIWLRRKKPNSYFTPCLHVF
ncbi:hypothetical protein LEP1GSC133_3794 [Leptospira borgpetersenii serovar Pomona str. 200901868]|uniref:Uncharacterized protein n=1 Tax=Leptospira borgpetersenii serovar Pomona str. 200901868 TaxID=1192866 RepID=M6VXP0_LEPBO|nr:hypothetical protein LEP1GSC133_3794 [Leptospira borgpetersenii serovar Pomona str. 200901868]